MTLELKVINIHCMTFPSSGCIHAIDSISRSILTSTITRIAENVILISWPRLLTVKMKVEHTFRISGCKQEKKKRRTLYRIDLLHVDSIILET